MPGINLLDEPAVKNRSAVFGEIFEHNAVDITKPAANLQYRWIVEGKWKLIVPNNTRLPRERPELYDVIADPKEVIDLSKQRPEIVQTLARKLDEWWPGKE